MENLYGYTAPTNVDPNAIGDEYVQLMITGYSHPRKYLKELAEDEKISGLPSAPSYKEGGVSLDYVIIYRSRSLQSKDCYEKIFSTDGNGKLIHPGFTVSGSLTAYPPTRIYKDGIFNQVKGFASKLKGGEVEEIPILPSTETVKWDNITNSMVKFNDIPPSHPFYTEMKEMEEKRIATWNTVIDNWKEKTEGSAVNTLLLTLANRYLICRRNDIGDLQFAVPFKQEGADELLLLPGITFTVLNEAKGKYLNPTVFKRTKINGKWVSKCHSALEVSYQPKEFVEAVKTCISEYQTQKAQEWAIKQAQKSTVEAEYYVEPVTDEQVAPGGEYSPW